MILAGIVAAELAFWAVLGLALAARYLLRWRRTSTILLLALPAVDVLLLALVVADLARGSEPTHSHALAASYLGFTLAFGHPLVSWADGRFAHRFTGAPRPERPAKGSAAHVRGLWFEWFRVVAAAAVAATILALLAFVVRHEPVPGSLDELTSSPLLSQLVPLGQIVVVWLLAGPAFARRAEGCAEGPAGPVDRERGRSISE